MRQNVDFFMIQNDFSSDRDAGQCMRAKLKRCVCNKTMREIVLRKRAVYYTCATANAPFSHSSFSPLPSSVSEPSIMTSSGFAALMALSQARTQESTLAADSINAERRRKEEARRRQQEEEDRKEREQQAKMLRHHLEEQKREKDRQLKREQEREAKLKEMERREEEQRQAMLYGPKKGRERTPRYPTSSAASRRASDDEDDGGAGPALTREEKRERRLQLQFSRNATRRSGSSAGTSRVGRRLPGGALNATTQRSQTGGGSADGGRSVRERLSAMPNTLTKLNTIKRDTRTIDEILRDRAKARENKTLKGEEAREFHNWFGTKSKAATTTTTSSPPSPKSPRPAPLTNKITASLGAHTPTKRARSPPSSYDGSESDSEYDRRPSKRAGGASGGIQDEIWKIFGRDRSKYMSRTVMSDDEDMEADMTALEREELTSARIARKEDLEAEVEERRHEEEKRRRRKDRERSG